jgi:uncharacterized membrane protein YqjE
MSHQGSPKLHEASLGELTGEMGRQISRLVRDEIHLAQVEMTQKGKRLGAGAGLMWAAGLLAVFGLACLVTTAVLALDLAWAAWLAAMVVGLVLFALAGVAVAAGRRQMRRATPPMPQEAMASAKEDIETLKGHHS